MGRKNGEYESENTITRKALMENKKFPGKMAYLFHGEIHIVVDVAADSDDACSQTFPATSTLNICAH